MRSVIFSIIGSVILIALFWLFFGNFKVTTTVDGYKVVGTPVMVNGVQKCKTPCKFRLWPGYYNISVERPEGFEIEEGRFTKNLGHDILTVFWGTDLNYEFESGRE